MAGALHRPRPYVPRPPPSGGGRAPEKPRPMTLPRLVRPIAQNPSRTRGRRAAGRALGAVVVAALLATPGGAQARPATGGVDALIARAAATYKAAKTATASFQQTLTNPMTGSAMVSRGVLQRKAPDKFAFTFTEPTGDRIIADGRFLWVYTPSTTPGQVIKLPAEAANGGMLDPGAQFFESPRSRFNIVDGGSATVQGRATRVLSLTPKSDNAPFTSATVWLDPTDGTLRQFETLDGMGVKRLVRLSDVKVNVALPGSAFTFTPPKGVRVVDGKGLLGGR